MDKRTAAFIGLGLGALTATYLYSKRPTRKLEQSERKQLAGKTYVIVGASSGMGRGVAEELGRCGANVVIGSRRPAVLEEIAQNIRHSGGEATVVEMDITKKEDLQRISDKAIEQYGQIDVWINMAGVGAIGPFWEIPQEDMAQLVDLNLNGAIYGSHTALQHFIENGSGVLINLASVDAEVPHAYHAAYSASKAGVKYLTLAIREELQRQGHKDIKVVSIEPWAVDTPFWTHAANYTGKQGKFLAMDEPSKLVNNIIRASINPSPVVPVGWKAKTSTYMERAVPRFNEWFSSLLFHKYEIEMGPPAPHTKGALYEPIAEGTEVEAGIDERLKSKGI